MTNFSSTLAHTSERDTSATAAKVAGGLLIMQWLLMFTALGILAPSINWPASLDQPASEMLPLIIEQRTAVALGYTSYFGSALLLIPIALLLAHVLRASESALVRVATGIGVLAGFAKLIGIGRWLYLMPSLAAAYVDPQTSAAARDAIAVNYVAFNAFGGGIGEVLGVTLLSGVWTALIAVHLLRRVNGTPFVRVLGGTGLLAAGLLLVGLAEVYGIGLGPILIVQGFAWQMWMLALGIFLLRLHPNV